MKINTKRTREVTKTVLFALVGAVILYSAVGKFMQRQAIIDLFTPLGMQDYMMRIAVIQLIIVGCLAYKPLRSLGVLVASAFLGGMIFMMLATDNSPLSAGITLLLLWVAYKLEWWGYWNHYTEEGACGCGWCPRSKHTKHHEFTTNCTCKGDTCKC